MGVIPETSTGFPGCNAMIPRNAATVFEILRQNGYGTAWIGDLALTSVDPGSDRDLKLAERAIARKRLERRGPARRTPARRLAYTPTTSPLESAAAAHRSRMVELALLSEPRPKARNLPTRYGARDVGA